MKIPWKLMVKFPMTCHVWSLWVDGKKTMLNLSPKKSPYLTEDEAQNRIERWFFRPGKHVEVVAIGLPKAAIPLIWHVWKTRGQMMMKNIGEWRIMIGTSWVSCFILARGCQWTFFLGI
jgi:hypothetical protein